MHGDTKHSRRKGVNREFDFAADHNGLNEQKRGGQQIPRRRKLSSKEEIELSVMGKPNEDLQSKINVAKEAMKALHHLREIQKIVHPSLIRKYERKVISARKLVKRRSWGSSLFLLCEDPSSSVFAKIVSIIILLLILLSCISLIIETLPRYSYPRYGEKQGDSPPIFQTLEYVCLSAFALEYLVRLASVSSVPEVVLVQMGYTVPVWKTGKCGGPFRMKWLGWLKHPMNIIDFFSVAPFFILAANPNSADGPGLQVLRVLRLTRIFRVFKLALYLLFFFMIISTVVFGSTIYYVERGDWDSELGYYVRRNLYGDGKERSPFSSIPRSFWWVIVTSTTVGYGDMVPTTTAGRIVGTVAMYFGILVIAMPLAIISSNFQRVHEEHIKHEQGYKNTTSGMSARLLELILSIENTNGEMQKVFAEIKALCGRYLHVANKDEDQTLDTRDASVSRRDDRVLFDESKLVLDEFQSLQEQLASLLAYKRTVTLRIRRLAEVLVHERRKLRKLRTLL